MELYIHAANFLFLGSYLVRDILKLRVLTVLGGCLLLAYFLTSVSVVWSAVAWNVLFSVINAYQIGLLILERRPVRMSAEEHRLHRLAFRTLVPREFVKLLRIVTWSDLAGGEQVVEAQRDPRRLTVVVSGKLEVRVDGARVAVLGPGQFVGEMTFLTGTPPKADVQATGAARVAAIDTSRLRALLADQSDLRAAIQGILGADLASKLRGDVAEDVVV